MNRADLLWARAEMIRGTSLMEAAAVIGKCALVLRECLELAEEFERDPELSEDDPPPAKYKPQPLIPDSALPEIHARCMAGETTLIAEAHKIGYTNSNTLSQRMRRAGLPPLPAHYGERGRDTPVDPELARQLEEGIARDRRWTVAEDARRDRLKAYHGGL